jgi:hypothetical protein
LEGSRLTAVTSGTPSASQLSQTDGALLNRTHLRELGLERRAVDAVFRELECVFLPGYSRPMIRVRDYLDLIERNTYRRDRVRPTRRLQVIASGAGV